MNFNLESLASEVKKLIDEHKNINQKSSFNIFKITGLYTSEVRICRLIYELLNKDGCHGQGCTFLNLFFKYVLEVPTTNYSLENFTIEREKMIESNRRIDLFLRDNNIAIPIEVKIFAEDQGSQLIDYYKYAQNSPIYYLTIDEHEPSDYSLSNKKTGEKIDSKDYRCISFNYHILNWLEKCLNVKGNDPSLNEILVQFIEAIRFITDKENEEMKKDILDVLKNKPEYFPAIREIADVLPDIQSEKMNEVFDAINGRYCSKFKVTSYFKEKTSRYYRQKLSTWPSICIELPLDKTNGYPLDIRIEVAHYLYIGLSNRDYSNISFGNDHTVRDKTKIERYNYVLNNLNPYKLTNSSDVFYWWCYILTKNTNSSAVSPQKELNFRTCKGKYERLFQATPNGFNSIMEEIYQTIDDIIANLNIQ